MNNAPLPIPELSERNKANFWRKVKKRADSIWAWEGAKLPNGRGCFQIAGRCYYAHRISWALADRERGGTGIIPDNLFVLHKNDVTPSLCDVNPDNLWLGTKSENGKDMMKKGRQNFSHGFYWSTGANNHCAKLTPEKVKEIRMLNRIGHTHRTIANQYGVSRGAIQKIILGLNWKHVV